MVGAVGVVVEGGCLTILSGSGVVSSSMGVVDSALSQSSSGLWDAIAPAFLRTAGGESLVRGSDPRFALSRDEMRACFEAEIG